MTINTTTTLAVYQGNGVTTQFTFPFVSGGQPSDIEVQIAINGVATTLSPTQYTLVINNIPTGGLWGIGGSVTYPIQGNPLTVGSYLIINRIVPFEQNISIQNQGNFYPQAVEQALDLLELQIQQLDTSSEYAITVPEIDPLPPRPLPGAAGRANSYLMFDGSGNPTVTPAPPPALPFGGMTIVASGSPVSVPTATATTLISNLTNGIYFVKVSEGASSGVGASCIVTVQDSVAWVFQLGHVGTLPCSFSMSGTSLQITQTTGSTVSLSWDYGVTVTGSVTSGSSNFTIWSSTNPITATNYIATPLFVGLPNGIHFIKVNQHNIPSVAASCIVTIQDTVGWVFQVGHSLGLPCSFSMSGASLLITQTSGADMNLDWNRSSIGTNH